MGTGWKFWTELTGQASPENASQASSIISIPCDRQNWDILVVSYMMPYGNESTIATVLCVI